MKKIIHLKLLLIFSVFCFAANPDSENTLEKLNAEPNVPKEGSKPTNPINKCAGEDIDLAQYFEKTDGMYDVVLEDDTSEVCHSESIVVELDLNTTTFTVPADAIGLESYSPEVEWSWEFYDEVEEETFEGEGVQIINLDVNSGERVVSEKPSYDNFDVHRSGKVGQTVTIDLADLGFESFGSEKNGESIIRLPNQSNCKGTEEDIIANISSFNTFSHVISIRDNTDPNQASPRSLSFTYEWTDPDGNTDSDRGTFDVIISRDQTREEEDDEEEEEVTSSSNFGPGNRDDPSNTEHDCDNGPPITQCEEFENEDNRVDPDLPEPIGVEFVSENISQDLRKYGFDTYLITDPPKKYLFEYAETELQAGTGSPESEVRGEITWQTCDRTGAVVTPMREGNPSYYGLPSNIAPSSATSFSGSYEVTSYDDCPNQEADEPGTLIVRAQLGEENTLNRVKQNVFDMAWDFKNYFEFEDAEAYLLRGRKESNIRYQKTQYRFRASADIPKPYTQKWLVVYEEQLNPDLNHTRDPIREVELRSFTFSGGVTQSPIYRIDPSTNRNKYGTYTVIPLEMDVDFEQPFADVHVRNDGGVLPVFAGCHAHVNGSYTNNGADDLESDKLIGVNIYAEIPEIDNDLIEKVEWYMIPGEDNENTEPRIVDLDSGNLSNLGSLSGVVAIESQKLQIDHTRAGDDSSIIAQYIYKENQDEKAKAGDSFEVFCEITFKGVSETIKDSVEFEIVPGHKALHISVDDSNPDNQSELTVVSDIVNGDIYDMSNEEFVETYGNNKIIPPIGSGDQKKYVLYCFDRYQNVVEEGTEVSFALHGGGALDSTGVESCDIINGVATVNKKTDARGRVSVNYTQTFYPDCPFSKDPESDLTSTVIVSADSSVGSANVSSTDSSGLFQQLSVGRVILTAGNAVDPKNPKINLQDSRDYGVTVGFDLGPNSSLVPLPNTTVYFTSLNGKIIPEDGVVTTDSNGYASVKLTSENAIPGEIVVIASVGTKSVRVDGTELDFFLEWETGPENPSDPNSKPAPQMVPEHEILAGNITSDSIRCIDTLDDTGESFYPWGGIERDFKLNIPVYAKSKMFIEGEPNHEYTIYATNTSMGNAEGSLHKVYSFDTIEPDVLISPSEHATIQSYDWIDNGAGTHRAYSIPDGEKRLVLDAQRNTDASILFSDQAAVAFGNSTDTELSFYFQADQLIESTILQKGNLSTEIIDLDEDSFRVRTNFVTNQGNKSVESDSINFGIDDDRAQWFRINLRTNENGVHLNVSRVSEENYLFRDAQGVIVDNSTYTSGRLFSFSDGKSYFYNGNETLSGNAQPVTLLFDESMGQVSIDFIEFDVLDQSAKNFFIEGLSNRGTITTDSEGKAFFTICSNGRYAENEYIPEEIQVTASGSFLFIATLYVTSDWFNADLVGCGKAFLTGTEGLGTDASWFEKASAWASESIPFASDLRTLSFEVYKGVTGCDTVNWWNVGFSVGGLILDAVSFGGGTLVKAGATGALKGGRAVLKEITKNVASGVAISAVVDVGLTSYMKYLNERAAKNEDYPEDINENTEGFLMHMNQNVKNYDENEPDSYATRFMESAISANSIIEMSRVYDELGAVFMEEFYSY